MGDVLKILPVSFNKNNLHYQQVKRNAYVAMYSAHLKEGDEPCAYEVFLVLQRKANTVRKADRVFELPDREELPSNEAFGTIAWSWLTQEQADRAYDRLLQSRDPVTGEVHESGPISRIRASWAT